MNNSDWLDEELSSTSVEDEVIWSELRTCTTGELPNDLYEYDLVRVKHDRGYSDDIPAHKIKWGENPTYQVLHQGRWNPNDGEQPDFVDPETYIQVILNNGSRQDNVGQIDYYWWGLGSASSIAYWRVLSRQNFLDMV